MNVSIPEEQSYSGLVFRADVQLNDNSDTVTLISPHGSYALHKVSPVIRTALHQLTDTPVLLSELLAPLTSTARTQLSRVLDRLEHLITRCILHQGQELARIEPTAREPHYNTTEITPDTPLKLSKFAFCRSRNNTLVLESPLAKHRVILSNPAAQRAVITLASPHTANDLCAGEIPLPATIPLLKHLAGAGFIDIGQHEGNTATFASETDPTLRQWDFHDLLFHSRSRRGRYDAPSGAVFPYRGEIDPQPAVKRPPTGPATTLPRPSLNDIAAHDLDFTTVLENRTSIRNYSEIPLTIAQLSEFLYRVNRIRAQPDAFANTPYEIAPRPYPCGGAAYELELYLTIARCEGINQGIYYYSPLDHQLILINSDPTCRQAMLHTAPAATGTPTIPDTLITITSRFQRLSWKYRSIAYAITLRNTGVLYQTMYLVATAMNLAPCALGNGDTDLATRALHLNYLQESPVGDFTLGSHPKRNMETLPPR